MKIRNGFVSNSSSSSFIVIFDKKPESIEELKELMFPNLSMDSLIDYYGDKESIESVVNIVYDDIVEQDKNSINSLIDIFNSFDDYSTYNEKLNSDRDIYVYTDKKLVDDINKKLLETKGMKKRYYESFHNKTPENIEFRKKYEIVKQDIDNLIKKLSEKDFEKFIEDNKDKYIAIFEYSDNDGNLSSLMEHYGIFDNIKHLYFNHH